VVWIAVGAVLAAVLVAAAVSDRRARARGHRLRGPWAMWGPVHDAKADSRIADATRGLIIPKTPRDGDAPPGD
jgi:hypothetical protein